MKFIPLPPFDRPIWLRPPLFKSARRIAELEWEVDDLKKRIAHLERWASGACSGAQRS
jgi:hypothetical protein